MKKRAGKLFVRIVDLLAQVADHSSDPAWEEVAVYEYGNGGESAGSIPMRPWRA